MASLMPVSSGQTITLSRRNILSVHVNGSSQVTLPATPLRSSLLQSHGLRLTEDKAALPQSYLVETSSQRFEELKKKAKKILSRTNKQTELMRLVDDIQRLGIAYHFEEEIDEALDGINNVNTYYDDNDLFAVSLRFRLLRQHGYNKSSDVFKQFRDKNGGFKQSLRGDIKGMLSLYEASHLGTQDEDILEEAKVFSSKHLKTSLLNLKSPLVGEINQALKLPRHMRMVRLEARNYIEHRNENISNPIFLELAKMDFNMVQSLHQNEINDILGWWRKMGLVEKLSFARDRPLECYMWTVGMFPEPHFTKCRVELTKLIAILLVLDDVFDSYGSLDELTIFTKAIERWDLDAMEELPNYMKICYWALYNTTNDIGYKVLQEYDHNIITYIKRTWKDICNGFLVEAQWFNQRYVPTIQEYLTNGSTTGGTYMALVHSFFLMGAKMTDESLSIIEPNPKIFSCSAMILRLWDDLGTSKDEKERGDVASSMECYMKENHHCTDEDARHHIKQLIDKTWKELNAEMLKPTGLPQSMSRVCLNLSRMSQVIYQHGDDPRDPSVEDHVKALLVDPISL